ncbi:NTP transferase domain-containing protein [Arenibaculum pallidiluteum]|uniref:NTP transferase domain-containing protein n=1 Tax=Arenibaculum pallidiluteum TaxID=2812559 RepID=UPI001A97432C|nr:molybdopterin-binding/glycosyltransferase family 2 protein [Arenibaculum pallidiluteum]
MRFGEIPLRDAEGAILAHSVRGGGVAFSKGRRLSAADLETLRQQGVDAVTAALIEPGDVAEDEAAARVAAAIAGGGLEIAAPFTGRVNLFATERGVCVVDAARLDRLNLLDESVTVATLPPFTLVEARQIVATIKVIPFAAPAEAVAAAEAVGSLIRVAPFRPIRAALVQTRLPGTKESVLDKTVGVTRARIEALGGKLDSESRGPHEAEAVAALVGEAVAAGHDMVLVAGASAITDRRDVLPTGIERAGGTVEHFGMPVDPGNLLLLARIGSVPVLGLPGCSRSPKLNGFDWVLQRLAAGIPVTRTDVMRMGAGGLLAEIPTRPLPRGSQGPTAAPRAPRVAAVILAAGRSTRMGSNKMLAPVDGRPMVVRSVERVLEARLDTVAVVTGHQHASVEAALSGLPVRTVHCPTYAEGLSESLKAGIAAVPADCDAALVCLGDMPKVGSSIIERLIAAYAPVEGRAICVPTAGGRRGNPVLWDRRFFPEIQDLRGDVGARHLIGLHADQVCEVAVEDPAIFLDIDTPEALAALRGG